MKRRYAVVLGIALGLVGSLVGFATVARSASEPDRYGPPIGPVMQRDRGAGELLLAVVGGVFETRQEAEAANAQMDFGDVEGYYIVPVGQFGGFTDAVGTSQGFALVSVFRTDEGARAFADFAHARQQPAFLVPERVQSFGGVYAGLGQEANPLGTGPLTGPIPASLPGTSSET
jgi:hypothetical protein